MRVKKQMTYKKYLLCNIIVFIRNINKSDKNVLKKCCDCLKPSKFIIKESNRTKAREHQSIRASEYFKKIWGYCGICEVG
jgi:hypothetical protein